MPHATERFPAVCPNKEAQGEHARASKSGRREGLCPRKRQLNSGTTALRKTHAPRIEFMCTPRVAQCPVSECRALHAAGSFFYEMSVHVTCGGASGRYGHARGRLPYRRKLIKRMHYTAVSFDRSPLDICVTGF